MGRFVLGEALHFSVFRFMFRSVFSAAVAVFFLSFPSHASGAVIFSDNFNNDYGELSTHTPTTAGTGWSLLINHGVLLYNQSYNSHANVLSNTTDAGSFYTADGTYSSADYEISSVVAFAGGDSNYTRTMAIRVQDANNMYFLRYGGNSMFRLYKMVSGVVTQLGTASVTISGNTSGSPWLGEEVSLSIIGNVLTAKVNGVTKLTVTDSSIAAAGKAGIGIGYVTVSTDDGGTGVGIDNVVVQTASSDSTAPTVTSVSSDKANGFYRVGEVIDIDVTFSEAVTSTGNVTVTLETGTTDRTCTFTVSNSTTGTCNYTVEAGDTSSDLTVNSVTGVVKDAADNTMISPATPTTNLSANKAIVIDTTAPTITSVSSDTATGSYNAGDAIDIDVTFSEAVTSTGNVTVTLETGTTDRTCAFTVSNSMTGTCTYTVQAGDTSSDLTVSAIAGTIADQSSNVMVSFTPATNLAANEALVIDTTAPSAPSSLSLNTPTTSPSDDTTPTITVSGVVSGDTVNLYSDSCTTQVATGTASSATIDLTSSVLSQGTYDFYVRSTDPAGNTSSCSSATVAYVLDITAPAMSSLSPSDGAVDVSSVTNLTLILDEAVERGTGDIVIHKASDDSIVETISVTSSQVTGAGTATITIDPSAALVYGTAYYVEVAATAFADLAGNTFAGISGAGTWDFSTAAEPEESDDLEVYDVEYEASKTEMRISWKTNNQADSRVEYGTDRDMDEKETDRDNEKKHEISIGGLKPDTLYYFRIRSEDENGDEDSSRVYSVVTERVESTLPIAALSLVPASSLPVYQELSVEVPEQPSKEQSTPRDEAPTFDPVETPKEIRDRQEDQYATEVFQRDGVQLLKEVRFQLLGRDGLPLAHLPVTLHSDPREGVTDEHGIVIFNDVPTGEHRLLFAYDGETMEKGVIINDLKQPTGPVKAEVIVITTMKDPLPLWAWGLLVGLSIALIVMIVMQRRTRRMAKTSESLS